MGITRKTRRRWVIVSKCLPFMDEKYINFTNIVIHMCPILLTHLAKLSLLNGVGGEFLILE
jgi:hypothetical protein